MDRFVSNMSKEIDTIDKKINEKKEQIQVYYSKGIGEEKNDKKREIKRRIKIK